MKTVLTRSRLLTGSALAAASFAIASPAEAACPPGTVTNPSDARICVANITTTDTTGPAATDRNATYLTTGFPTFFTVNSAVLVDGYGAAVTQADAGTNAITITNNGTVQVNTGLAPTAGGIGALTVTGTNAPIVYQGTGDVLNLGVGNGLGFNLSGTSSLTANVGGSVRSGTGAIPGGLGIIAQHSGTAGNMTVTTAGGETVNADSIGILLRGANAAYAGNISLANNATVGSLTGTGTLELGIIGLTAGTGSVTVTNGAGNIGSATDRIALIGVGAEVLNPASTANVSVTTGAGQVWSSGLGIYANNDGSGTVSVTTGSGALNAVGGAGVGTGILTDATSGATTVTVGAGGITAGNVGVLSTSTTGAQTINVAGPIVINAGGTDGVNATSTSGALAVNVQAGGGITAIDDAISLNSNGARTVTIAAGRTVTGAAGVRTTGTGTTTITNSGTLAGTTAAIVATAPTAGAITVNNLAGATLTGPVTLTDANDTITSAGTINASGNYAFLSGTDLLTNQAGGVLNVAAGTTFTGLETLNNAGTVNAGSGLTFDAGNTALNNTGTLNLAGAINLGAGTDSFGNTGPGILNLTGNASIVGAETITNSGRFDLNTFALTGSGAFNNTGTIDTNGNASLLGFTTLSNAGTVDLAAGTLTLPAVVFTNTGTILADEGASTITGQTSFANSGTLDLQDGAIGDVLTINSPFAGLAGSNLLVDFSDAAADRLVINGAASGATTVNATYVGAGLINVGGVLVVDAVSASPNAFVLGTVGGNTSPLVDYSLAQNGGDFLLVSRPNASAFAPLAVTSFGRSLWYQSADEVIAQTRLPAETIGASFWGQIYLSRDRMDHDSTQVLGGVAFDVDHNLRTKRRGIQLGADYGFGAGRVGLTGGYARAKADNRGVDDIGLKANGWNIGAYGQFGGRTGLHGEFLVKHDRYDLDFNDGLFDGEGTDARANGIDGSVGYRFGMGGATLDANAGISFVRTKFDDIDAFGFGYDLGTVKSTRGRAGVRATFGGTMSPYIDGTVYREFRGDGRVALFDGANFYGLENEGKGTWFRVEGGVVPNPTGLMLAAWADLGDKKGLGARLGFRFGGGAVAAPPPPPPPPPAPPPEVAPATQTCADGSVILATDLCPAPPPPPPPPAPEPVPERG